MSTSDDQPERLPVHYSLGVMELVAIVRRRKVYLFVCLAAAFALGGIYYFKAERTYEITCRLLVEQLEVTLGEPRQQQRAFRDFEFLATQAEILGSTPVVAATVNRIQWPIPPRPDVSPVALLKDRLTVRPVMGTDVLSVSLQANDGVRGVQAIEALVRSYREYLKRDAEGGRLPVLEMLARTEKETRAELDQLEDRYRHLRGQSPLIGSGQHGMSVQLALVDQLGQKLSETRGRRIDLESRLQIATRQAPSTGRIVGHLERPNLVHASLALPIPSDRAASERFPAIREGILADQTAVSPTLVGADLPGAPDMAAIQNQIIQTKLLESQLLSRFGDKHPDVRAAREQLASLRKEEKQALQTGEDLLRRELDALAASEEQLSQLRQDEVNKAKLIDHYLLDEQQLTGQIARVQTLYDSILAQLRQWKLAGDIIAEGRSEIQVAVLSPPVVPRQPVWPSPIILFGICGAIGVLAGSSLIVLVEQRATSPLARSAASQPVGRQSDVSVQPS